MYVDGAITGDSADVDNRRRKPAWEVVVRQRLSLPRYSTANDGAAVLLRMAATFALVACVTVLTCSRWIGILVLATASGFVGLAVQQYTWYTSRIFVECWKDEGHAVASVAGLMALIVGGLTTIFWLLLPLGWRLSLVGGLHTGLLTSHRWAFWGSLFDGVEKQVAAQASRAR